MELNSAKPAPSWTPDIATLLADQKQALEKAKVNCPSSPSLTFPNSFTLDPNTLVQAVTYLASLLMHWKTKKPSLMDSFCLELRRWDDEGRGDEWKMSIRLDVLQWFQLLLKEQGINEASCLGRLYIQFVEKEEQKRSEDEQREEKVQEPRAQHTLPSSQPTTGPASDSSFDRGVLKKQCPHGMDCWHEHKCKSDHVYEHCLQMVRLRLGYTRTCGWYHTEALELFNEAACPWLLLARPRGEREILLLPRPPEYHMSNQELVQKAECWQIVIDQLHRIEKATAASTTTTTARRSVSHIVVKFGRWETEESKDDFSLSCHAHVHYYITKQAVEFCKSLPTVNKFSKLRDADQDPEDFTLRDAASLHRIVGDRTAVDELTRAVEDLRRRCDRLTQETVD